MLIIVFLDFEVTKYDWLVVIIEPDKKKETVIVNDPDKLKNFYESHKKDIYVGHNIKGYDQFIFKGIILDMKPKKINDHIIVEELSGYTFSKAFNDIPLIIYDTMSTNKSSKSLKTLEGMMGNSIEESKTDFTVTHKLTEAEIQDMIKYCRHDVEQTIQVFLNEINEFNSAMGLINMFPEVLNIYDLRLTKAQMSAKILECNYKRRNDEFNVSVLPCIQLNKYKSAAEFFLNPENHWYKRGTKKNKFEIVVAGLVHTLGWGGIHGGKEKYHLNAEISGRLILHIDVEAFYPRLMIFHKLLTRNCKRPEKFRQIYDKRIKLKRAGKKKEQAPLKIVINGTFGICKDKHSQAFDPLMANLICLNGQLMLLDLIEHLEVIEGFELIQSNTDGLIISIPDTDAAFNAVDDVCYEWETRCNMELAFDHISEIYEKDVNNYVFRFENGKLERKGSYVKELSSMDYDLPIINKALVDYMMNGIPIEKTINDCDDLHQFQMVIKISSKYENLRHGDQILREKCVRVFASTDRSDGGLFWKSARTGTYGKVTSTPIHCFINNLDVKGVKPPRKLDKQWYLDLARKRLNDYGVYY